MSYSDLLNELTSLAVKEDLTEEDIARLSTIQETFARYRKHPFGKVMRHWHDLGCELDTHSAYLEYCGKSAVEHRSKAKFYHQKAEDVRLKIEAE